MNIQKLQVKLFVDGPALPVEGFIPVFHDWVKHQRLGELLIDVANYTHVPNGPAVGIVGHGSDYFIDCSEGRHGLLYSRKRDFPAEPLRDGFRRALTAAVMLEKEPAFAGKLRFGTDELQFRINDRLTAPATETTFAAVRPQLDAFLTPLLEGSYKLSLVGSPRELFTVKITTDKKLALATLLERL